jgi:hypothetical protein
MRVRLVTFFLFLFCWAASMAQLPTDNDGWKARCNTLGAADGAIQGGTISPSLVSATRGVDGAKFMTFGWDRAAAGEHNVACTMFYMAAIAGRVGNGGKQNFEEAHNAQMMGLAEYKLAHRQKLTMREHFKRSETKSSQLAAKPLTAGDSDAVLRAATTMPVSSVHPVAKTR